MIRKLNVIKMRGINFRSGAVIFNITSDGIVLYPKIPVERGVASTEFKHRLSTGIKRFDKIVGNGFPEGHMIMYAGNTGSGKTTFGMQFLIAGLKKGEAAVFLALEESASQIKKTALEHGWNLDKYEEQGKLIFINPSMIDVYPDEVLYAIVTAVRKIKAKRIVIDSV